MNPNNDIYCSCVLTWQSKRQLDGSKLTFSFFAVFLLCYSCVQSLFSFFLCVFTVHCFLQLLHSCFAFVFSSRTYNRSSSRTEGRAARFTCCPASSLICLSYLVLMCVRSNASFYTLKERKGEKRKTFVEFQIKESIFSRSIDTHDQEEQKAQCQWRRFSIAKPTKTISTNIDMSFSRRIKLS